MLLVQWVSPFLSALHHCQEGESQTKFIDPNPDVVRRRQGKKMPAIMGHLKNGRAQGGAMTVGGRGAISFTATAPKASKYPNRPQLRAERSRKNVRDLLPRTACWLSTECDRGQPNRRIAREPFEVVPSQSPYRLRADATRTRLHPSATQAMLRGRALIQSARLPAQTSVKRRWTAKTKGHHAEQDYRDRNHYGSKASSAAVRDSANE